MSRLGAEGRRGGGAEGRRGGGAGGEDVRGEGGVGKRGSAAVKVFAVKASLWRRRILPGLSPSVFFRVGRRIKRTGGAPDDRAPSPRQPFSVREIWIRDSGRSVFPLFGGDYWLSPSFD